MVGDDGRSLSVETASSLIAPGRPWSPLIAPDRPWSSLIVPDRPRLSGEPSRSPHGPDRLHVTNVWSSHGIIKAVEHLARQGSGSPGAAARAGAATHPDLGA